MVRHLIQGAVALATFLAMLVSSIAVAAAEDTDAVFTPPKRYYLALGDSIGYGFQTDKAEAGLPPEAFDTGFVDLFSDRLRTLRPGNTTVNYSCPGESTRPLPNPMHLEGLRSRAARRLLRFAGRRRAGLPARAPRAGQPDHGFSQRERRHRVRAILPAR